MKFNIIRNDSENINEAGNSIAADFRLMYMNLFHFIGKELGIPVLVAAADPKAMESGGKTVVTFKSADFSSQAKPNCFDKMVIVGEAVYDDGWNKIYISIMVSVGGEDFVADIMTLKVLPKQKFAVVK